MNSSEIKELISEISFMDYDLIVVDAPRMYLQGQYYEPDVVTGEIKLQKTRKWMLSEHMTKSEIVQTAFKLALTSMEHRTREHFLYSGERVYSPHYDVDALVELCRAGAFDEREDWYEEDNPTTSG
ncbi:MAG: hypothetical protein IPM50_09265 [Acidobacteriota bacterium]|nr:MAG: hypothetical protein IPM50_09265 [Acidobacteriota bacterium]